MGKLSDTKCRNAKPKPDGKENVLSDGQGLSLRVRGSVGSGVVRSWIFRYLRPLDQKAAKVTLGEYPALTLADARERAAALRVSLADGVDPKHFLLAKHAGNASVMTLGQLFDDWMKVYKVRGGPKGRKPAEKTVKYHCWRWDKYLAPRLQDIRVTDLTRAHLNPVFKNMRDITKEETRKAIYTMNMMLEYALNEGMIRENPARLVRPKDHQASQSDPRERVLSLIELRQLCDVVAASGLTPAMVAAIKILILTGARRQEVAGMAWQELNLSHGVWFLPETRTKNRKAHKVFLSRLAVQTLEELVPVTGQSGYVFESDRLPGNPIHVDSINTALQRLQQAHLPGISPFTVHDLRRSAATGWGEEFKAPPHVIERMLNHRPKNLEATYQRHKLEAEQRKIWCQWGHLIASGQAESPSNVVAITATRSTFK